MTNTVPPGVDPVSGLLTNPEAYFWWLIQRAPNQPADDWETVLGNCGLPAGYPPYMLPGPNGYYGLTQQIGSDGRIAGRIFLPTRTQDELGYYSAPVSPLKDAGTPGHLLWEWRPLGGPPYVPCITEQATGGGGGNVSPTPGLSTDDIQAMIDASLIDVVKYGAKVALTSSGDAGSNNAPKTLCAEGGGPMTTDTAFVLTSRSGANDPGPWESWEIKRGQ